MTDSNPEPRRLAIIDQLQSEVAHLQSLVRHHTMKDALQHVLSDLAATRGLIGQRPIVVIDLAIQDSAARLQSVVVALRTRGPSTIFADEPAWSHRDVA